MSSAAHVNAPVATDAATTAQHVLQVLAAEKATVTATSPDGLTIDFTTRKTMFTWELEGRVIVTPLAQGSGIDLHLNTHHNRPTALLDKAKNDKAAQKLLAKITGN